MAGKIGLALALLAVLAGNGAAAESDLMVGWISRAPRMDYVIGSANPAREGWPAPGQVVTWEAHVKNWSDLARTGVDFRWLLDGAEVARGRVDVPAGASVAVPLPREWRFERHVLTFEIDPENRVAEDEEGNNSLSVFTDALSVGFHVEQGLYDYFHANQRFLAGAHSNGFEDWAQRHVRRFNEMAAQAAYPETPAGVLDRWRLDEVVIVPDGALADGTDRLPDDHSVDLAYGFPANTATLLYPDVTTVDQDFDPNDFYVQTSLLHELGHARYLVDVYGWWVGDGFRGDQVNILEGTARVVGSPLMPFQGGQTFVHRASFAGLMNQSYGFIDRYSAAALNRIAGHRATNGNVNAPGNIGSFLNDLPEENVVTVTTAAGDPIPNADVWIYQSHVPTPSQNFYTKIFENVPDLRLRSDAAGRVRVGRCPFSADGRIVHEFGRSNVTAIVRVAAGGVVAYGFLESLGFNLAAWRGETTVAEHVLVVGEPVCGLPDPPALLDPAYEATLLGTGVVLRWTGVRAATAYDVWAARDGGPARLLATLAGDKTSLEAELAGRVTWWVVAARGACPSVRSGIGLFAASRGHHRATAAPVPFAPLRR